MDVIGFLDLYAPIALAVFVIGVGLKFGRWFKYALTGKTFSARSKNAIDPPESRGAVESFVGVLWGPIKNYYLQANSRWAWGFVLYHIAIITVTTGYIISAFILASRVIQGDPIPNVATGAAESQAYNLTNFLAIIFGNAEPVVAEFLFGGWADAFIAITWVDVGIALLGNLSLMVTVLGRRTGAVLADLESATAGIRTSGTFQWDSFLIRATIFLIIWMEVLGRLNVAHDVVYYHAILGVTLIMLTPFTYLRHILFIPITLYYATKRRMNRTVA